MKRMSGWKAFSWREMNCDINGWMARLTLFLTHTEHRYDELHTDTCSDKSRKQQAHSVTRYYNANKDTSSGCRA